MDKHFAQFVLLNAEGVVIFDEACLMFAAVEHGAQRICERIELSTEIRLHCKPTLVEVGGEVDDPLIASGQLVEDEAGEGEGW